MCKLVPLDDDRLMGMIITVNCFKILLLNVYLPYQNTENYDNFIEYLGKIEALIERVEVTGVIIIGDFNSDPNKDFYKELKKMCDHNELTISDVNLMPSQTYTHVNNGSLGRFWLDHCITSPAVHSAITSMDVNYLCNASDHLPLTVSIKLDSLPRMENQPKSNSDDINWNFMDQDKAKAFYSLLTLKLTSLPITNPECSNTRCDEMSKATGR